MMVQTFPHDIVEELHDGDPAVRVVVQQLGIHSGCEEFSEGGETNLFHYVTLFSLKATLPYIISAVNMFPPLGILAGCYFSRHFRSSLSYTHQSEICLSFAAVKKIIFNQFKTDSE